MRHSDSRITLQKYSHVIGDAQRRAVDSLAGRVLGISFGANSVNWSQKINKRFNINNLAEACGSRIYSELIFQVLTKKLLDGIGRT